MLLKEKENYIESLKKTGIIYVIWVDKFWYIGSTDNFESRK